jgi:nitrogen fixation NifU-like protein
MLDDIYKEVILDHYKNPRNRRRGAETALSCTRNNPLCGDEITVFVRQENGRLADVSFEGAGCSISQSSASMMTEAVRGRTVGEASGLAGDFRGMMAGDVEADEATFGDLVALKGVVKYPIRIKCAVLPWDVLQEALREATDSAADGGAPATAEASSATPDAAGATDDSGLTNDA